MEEPSTTPLYPTSSSDSLESIPPRTPRLSLRPIYMALTLVFGMLMGAGGLFAYQEFSASPPITSYETCIKAKGSILQESYPATCVTKDGERFIQPIDATETNPIYFDPMSCNTDSDCTVGIQSDACCSCPRAINVREIGKDGWSTYGATSEKNPSGSSKKCQTFAACAPCEKPSQPVCRNNRCTLPADAVSTPQPGSGYTCPATEWVDCMPGPDAAGIKFECTETFLSWATANCPNFQGAAL